MTGTFASRIKIERRTKPYSVLLGSLKGGADLAGQRMRKLFYKTLSVVIVQMGIVLFIVPLMGIGLLFSWNRSLAPIGYQPRSVQRAMPSTTQGVLDLRWKPMSSAGVR